MPPTPARFTRVLARGDRGGDVVAVSRAYIREGLWPTMTLTKFGKLPEKTRATFDDKRVAAQKRLEKQLQVKQDGVYARQAHNELVQRGAFDATSRRFLENWKPVESPLIEPKQGFGSLHKSLWRLYTIGIMRGFFDLGTYNPQSKLPGGNISDHATAVDCATTPSSPAMAFDLGIHPQTGWDCDGAREYVLANFKRPEVEYMILGDKICFREQGIKPYTAGGHMNHIHVSGNRKTNC